MNIHEDFEEFLKFLKDDNVEFLIIGGYAVAFHGYVRSTNDIDLFFRNTKENILKICLALERFGISTNDQQEKQFSEPGNIIRMGVPPVRIELLNTISGVSFEQAWTYRESGKYGEVPVYYISINDLIKNKKSSGRLKDLADIDELGYNRNP